MAGRMTRMQRSGSQSLETVYSYGAGNLLTRKTTRFSDRRYEQQAEYNKNNQPTSYVLKQNGLCRNQTNYTYDGLGRLTWQEIWDGTSHRRPVDMSVDYLPAGTGKTTGLVKKLTVNGRSFAAEYDGNGNIVSILDSAEGRTEYEYDALNQLTKVTYPDGTEYSYVYDAGGNLTQWNKNGTTQHIAHYATTGWKDQFVYLDGTGIQYDEIGNPLTWRLGVNLTWEAGRRLSTLQKGETSVSYTYNAEGTRIGKTVNGRSKNYLWDGGKLLSQTFANDTQVFLYHGDSRVALEFMGQLYYYVYNLQGDVVGLVDKTGTTMVTYKYDVWGKPESTTGPMATTLGVANPFRYRGYYYDTESGFYYLQSRYYDPEVGRFLNADAYLNSGHMLGTNAYVYCYNNPVMYADYTGCIPEWLYAVAAAAAAADGPLPFGDLLLVGVCVAGAVSALSALPQIEAPERHLTEIIPFPNQNNNNNKKKQEGPAPLIPPITAPRPKEEKRPKYPDEIYAANAAYPGAYVTTAKQKEWREVLGSFLKRR